MIVTSPFKTKRWVIRKRHPGAEALHRALPREWVAPPHRWQTDLIPEGLRLEFASMGDVTKPEECYKTASRSLSHYRTAVIAGTKEEAEHVESIFEGNFDKFAAYYGGAVAQGLLLDTDFCPSPTEVGCTVEALKTLLTKRAVALVTSSRPASLSSMDNGIAWENILEEAGFIRTGIHSQGNVLMPDNKGVDQIIKLMFGNDNLETWRKNKLKAARTDLVRAVRLTLENRILKNVETWLKAQSWKLCEQFDKTHKSHKNEIASIRRKAGEQANHDQMVFEARLRNGIETINVERHDGKAEALRIETSLVAQQERFYLETQPAVIRAESEIRSLLEQEVREYTNTEVIELHKGLEEFIKAFADYQKVFTTKDQIEEIDAKRVTLRAEIDSRRTEVAVVEQSIDLSAEAYSKWRTGELEKHAVEARTVHLYVRDGEFVGNLQLTPEQIEQAHSEGALKELDELEKAKQTIPERLLAARAFRSLHTEEEILNLKPLSRLEPPCPELLEAPKIVIGRNITATPNLPAKAQLLLDGALRIYNPVLQTSTSAHQALLEKPVIISQGADYIREKLQELDYQTDISEQTINRIEKEKQITERIQTPNRDLYGTECLAYYKYGPAEAKEDISDPDGKPIWIKGRSYMITPGWKSGMDILSREEFIGESSLPIVEERRAEYQYTYWSVETEEGVVEIKETANRQELEIEESLRRDPNQTTLQTPAENLEQELQQRDEDAMRLRVELNSDIVHDPEDDTRTPDAVASATAAAHHQAFPPWKPCLDEFVATFPPPIPLPVMLKYESEITALMAKAYARFGPKYLTRALKGQPLQLGPTTEKEAREIFAFERKPDWPIWDQLPIVDMTRVTATDEVGPIDPNRFCDKVKYYDRSEGRLENILNYQLREAAIGAFKGSAIDNTSQGGGKTIRTIIHLYLLGCKHAYIITGRKLLKNWEEDCRKLKIQTSWIKGADDARALKQRLKSGIKDPNPEPQLHLISVEWICLGGGSNMKYLPWVAQLELSKEYDGLEVEIGLFVLGPENPNVVSYREQIRLRTDEVRIAKENRVYAIAHPQEPPRPPAPAHDSNLIQRVAFAARTAGIAWLRDPERNWNVEGVSLEQHLTQYMDRGWTIDAERLTDFLDHENDPTSKVKVRLEENMVDIVCEDESAKPDIRATELRFAPKMSAKSMNTHPECPSCGKVHEWNGHHCGCCGFNARYYSSQRTRLVQLDRKAKKLKIFLGEKRSARFYPGYKLLPKVDAKVIDEFHLYTSFSTLHGKAIHDIHTKYTIVTSGTMVRSRVSQVQPALVLAHRPNSPEFPYTRQDMSGFGQRFSTFEILTTGAASSAAEGRVKKKKTKKEAPEASNLNGLRRLLHSRVIGVDEETVEREWKLDKIVERIVRFELTETEDDAYRRVLTEVNAWQERLKHKMAVGTYEEIKEARRELIQGTRHRIDSLKAVCNGPSKMQATVRWAHQIEQQGHRGVIVCKSVDLYEQVKRVLECSGLPFDCIDAKISTEDRYEALDIFAAKKKPILLSRIKLICEGFNQLVCTSWQLFLELEDITGHNRQMQKRSNRPGQQSQVHCDFLIGIRPGINARRTIDEIQLANFVRRDRALAELTSKNTRYRGPTALMEELQERQGLLRVMEEIAANNISEIKASSFGASDGELGIISTTPVIRNTTPQLIAS